MEIKEIDGSQGEGGGQVLRTSISLSACMGQPVRIRNIRSGRKKPGLMRQHLSCVKAAAEICNAKLKGAFIGSKAVEFIPGVITAGEYHFSIGSAGSSCLVFQTILPLFLLTKKTSTLIFEGGTHNPLAPSYDFLKDVFLPMLEKMGLGYKTTIEQHGFYPVGAGRWQIEILPAKQYHKLKIEKRGDRLTVKAKCIAAGIPAHVVQREKKKLLEKTGWPETSVSTEIVRSLGSGNVVSISAHYTNTRELVDSIGAIGIPAEKVAITALNKFQTYQTIGAPVGEYLADQLLVPLVVLSGGAFVTGKLSKHTLTNIDVIRQITAVEIKAEQVSSKNQWRICVG